MRRYTKNELHEMNLEALKSVCKEHRIKSDIKDFYNDENTMRKLIYRYRGREEPVMEPLEDPIEIEEEPLSLKGEPSTAEEKHSLIDEETAEIEERAVGFISEWNDEKISFLQSAFERNKHMELDGFKIKIRNDFEIYKNIDCLDEYRKGYKVFFETDAGILDNADIAMTNAFIVDASGTIQAILDVSENVSENICYLSLRKGMLNKTIQAGFYNDFRILFFPVDFEKVFRIYNERDETSAQFSYVAKSIKKTTVKELEVTEDTLFIDYGNHYTTAAVYTKNVDVDGAWEIHQIYFYSDELCAFSPNNKTYYADSNCRECGRCGLCPSIIVLKDCCGDKFKFAYGHEAKRSVPVTAGSIFMDTKRWLNNADKKIEVTDEAGNYSMIKYAEVIKAFLQYIILCAERQTKKSYKNICFLNAFEQKNERIEVYEKLLNECNTAAKAIGTSLEKRNGDAPSKNLMFINEAIAAIYHSLEQNKEAYNDGERKSILFVDCGSNASYMLKADLAIKSRDGGVGNIFDMAIGFESGVPNFGGNKLTYRLMQYIKIRLTDYYKNECAHTVKDLLGISNAEVYASVDEKGLEKIYDAFEAKYREIKDFIPTDFSNYISEEEVLSVKRNFYFLWSLAEQIKICFYENTETYEFLFENLAKDDSFYAISVKTGSSLEICNECPPIRILREEINLLFKPEIYCLLKKFIEPYYDNNTIYDVANFIFLGQTTNIGLFREVLKEYIAGGKGASHPYKKLKSVRGAALYYGAVTIGSISPNITYYPAKQPYYLTAELFAGFSYEDGNDYKKEKVFLKEGQPLSELYSFIDRNYNTKKIAFILRDYNKAALKVFEFKIDINTYKETNENELKKKYTWLKRGNTDRQGDIDRISYNSLRIFVYGDDENWGFSWLCIAKKENGSLYCGAEHVVAFEAAYADYFDGKR